jgi:predicted enzyme related to lactoylglutathione lyase
MLDTHPITVNIHEGQPPKNQRFDSTEIAFYVDDVEKVFQYLKSKNVKITRNPVIYPNGVHMFNMEDPEGNSLSFVKRP